MIKTNLELKMKYLLLIALWFAFNKINCTVLVPKLTNKSKNSDNQQHSDQRESDEIQDDFFFCESEEYLHTFISFDNRTQTILVTWNRTKVGERAILPNICSIENGLPLQRRCSSYSSDKHDMRWEHYNNATVLIDCRISMFCQTEAFQHYLIKNNGQLKWHHNLWKKAKIGELSSLRDVCLQSNGLQLTRKCFYDVKKYRAQWAPVNHLRESKCIQDTQQQLISRDLNALHNNLTTSNFLLRDIFTRRNTATTLLNILVKPKTRLLPADVQMTSDILKSIASDNQDSELSGDILKITNSLMTTDPVVLRLSAEVNATNCLLETFENFMNALAEQFVSFAQCNINLADLIPENTNHNNTIISKQPSILNLSNIGVYAHIAHNISVFYVNPICANISGIAIYDSYQHKTKQLPYDQNRYSFQSIRYDSYNDFHYRFIYMNESIHDLLQEQNLELASYIPTRLWSNLKSLYLLPMRTPIFVFKIFAHDGLFVEQTLVRLRKPFSKVLSISIPGFEEQLPESLPLILRTKSPVLSKNANINTGCGYWNYSTWISNGVATNTNITRAKNDLILCLTNHLTQFSYLLGGGFRQNDLSDEILVRAVHQQALDIISLIGCSLSLLGLLGIWITALVFKSWRSQSSNIVLLNMCVALTLQMVLFLFVNTDDISETVVERHNYTKCVVLGALMHYSILVLFTWMLIVAFLQFQRYVTIIGISRPKHYIIKSAIVAWGLPLIPTILIASLYSKSYIPSDYQLVTDTGICYPSGNALYFGVILPVSLIVMANLAIFVYVFYSISHTLSNSMQRNEKQMVLKQIRLSILLFFLLGLSWIFGIFAFMKAGIVFSYLFCLTATLQGFVLFIYFVALDQNTRESWLKLFFNTCCSGSHRKKLPELQLMTTASTSFTHGISSTGDHET